MGSSLAEQRKRTLLVCVNIETQISLEVWKRSSVVP